MDKREMETKRKSTKGNGMKTSILVLAILCMAVQAHAGKAKVIGKVVGKAMEHGGDNVLVHVTERGGERGGKALAEGAGKAVTKGGLREAGKVAETGAQRMLKSAEAEVRKSHAKEILAIGGAGALLDGAHNVTKGMQNRNEAVGRAEEQVFLENPDLVRQCREQGVRWKNILATGGAVAMAAFAVLVGLSFGLGPGWRRWRSGHGRQENGDGAWRGKSVRGDRETGSEPERGVRGAADVRACPESDGGAESVAKSGA